MKRILSMALIFVLCFTLFACGDENNTDTTTTTTSQNTTTTTTTEDNTTSTTTEDNTTTKNQDSNSISVVDAVDYSFKFEPMYLSDEYEPVFFNVRLPKIVGNTATINELNLKMLNEALSSTYSSYSLHIESVCATEKHNTDDVIVFNKGETFDYDYIVKNNVLVIYISSTVPYGSGLYGQSGDGMYRASYCYDIANDKVLSTSQAVDKLDLPIPEYAKDFYPEGVQPDDLDGGSWSVTLYDNELELVFNI